MGRKQFGLKSKILSMILILTMLLEIVSPAIVEAADKATSRTSVIQDGIYINIDKKLEDFGNGLFKLSFNADSHYKKQYQSTSESFSKNGYLVAPVDGYYLIELWGGEGSGGRDTLQSEGGLGGAAGYTYGYVWLEKGQTLVCHVGGNGVETSREDVGGGANGNGGGHGDFGIYFVGGGGGYSAVYLLDESRESAAITSAERLTKYIMIAGGGGGGGAGNQPLFEASGRPSGGAAGHIHNSTRGTLSTNDSAVAGTYFRGANGLSSGTSTDYIGRGGTNVPGKSASTILNLRESTEANDWTGTYAEDSAGGAGGSGNLRGGGGGAGFSGGSGGIMTSSLLGTNVGGGGGGSSFIADIVTFENLPQSVSNYLQGRNGSETGGSCIITYLGESVDNKVETGHLGNMTLEGMISTYFDVLSVNTQGNGQAQTDANNNITISGIDIEPTASGYAGNKLNVEILIRAKEGFMGGNNVPVIGDMFTVASQGHEVINIKNDNSTDFANVPLNFKAIAKSYMSSDKTKTYPVSSLYQDDYASIRSNIGSYWQYDFINSVSAYSVTKEGETAVLTGNVNPQETTRYTVGFTVTPKDTGIATVGEPVKETFFSETATISIVGSDTAMLNDITVTGSKALSFDGTNYIFDINVDEQSKAITLPSPVSKTENGSYQIEKSGWYYIQAWGGNGGNAGTAKMTGSNGNNSYTASGGTGGAGGYVGGYIHLEAGQVVSYEVGAKGGNSGNVSETSDSYWTGHGVVRSSGGSGGKYSAVRIDESYVMVAGGGGGGGGAVEAYTQVWGPIYHREGTGRAGSAGSTTTHSATLDSNLSNTYNGKSGSQGSGTANQGSLSPSATGGAGGAAGSNFMSSSMNAGGASAEAIQFANGLTKSKGSVTSGKVVITCLETDEAIAEKDKLGNMSLAGTFSKYFEVKKITASGAQIQSSTVGNGDGTTRFDITDLDPTVLTTRDGQNISYSARPVVSFTLNPKEGFLGGNDVPVLVYDATEPGNTDADNRPDRGVKITLGNGFMWLTEKEVVDFANVAIDYDFLDENFETQDMTILCGETVDQSNLIKTNKIPMPTGAEAWKADFVNAVNPDTEQVSPTETTAYSFKQQIEPKSEAKKAIIIPSVTAAEFEKLATVFVQYKVIDNMESLNFEGADIILDGENLSGTIVPEEGYVLPNTISVVVGERALSSEEYEYDSETGELYIEQSLITDHVTLSAAAEIKTYELHYVYETDEGVAEHIEEYAAGQSIDLTWYNNFSTEEREGYEFTWAWETEDGNPLTIMPTQNWYVFGSYTPRSYDLTIHYYLEGTTEEVADTYVKTMIYGSEYNIVSPNIEGYTADQVVVSGVLESDKEVNVYYTPNDGVLTIFYIYGNTNEQVQEPYINNELRVGDTYDVLSPNIDGYTPQSDAVSGVMPESGGVTEYVYYYPNTYTVTFDADDGIIDDSEKTKEVEYHNIYGYNQDTQNYSELPQPIKNGYSFIGWQDEDGNLVDEESVVQIAADHTLKAKWEVDTYKLTIYYNYSNGETAKETYTDFYEYGAAYEIATPSIVGHTADITTVSGVMGAGNKVVIVTYSIDSHFVTVHYIGPDGNKIADDRVIEAEYGSSYEIVSPNITGYTADKEKITGTIGTKDVEFTVTYSYIDYTLTVNYAYDTTVEETPESFVEVQPSSYVQKGLHIGDTYVVESPVLEGFTAIPGKVEGVMGGADVTATVLYQRNRHTLKISYIYDESIADETLAGTEVKNAEGNIYGYSQELGYGDSYEIASPVVEGYKPSSSVVKGKMPDGDVEVIVRYYDQDTVILMYQTNNSAYGTVDPAYEIVKINSDPNGDTVGAGAVATVEDGSTFKGWYKDINGTEPVGETWVQDEKITPVVEKIVTPGAEGEEDTVEYLDATYFAVFEPNESDIKLTVTAEGAFADKTREFTGKLNVDCAESNPAYDFALANGGTVEESFEAAQKMWLSDLEDVSGYELVIQYKVPGSEELKEWAVTESKTEKISVPEGTTEIFITYKKSDVLNTGIGDGVMNLKVVALGMVEIILVLMFLFLMKKRRKAWYEE